MDDTTNCSLHTQQIQAMEKKLALLDNKVDVVENQQKDLKYDIRGLRSDIEFVKDGNTSINIQLTKIANLIENGKGAWWLLTKIAILLSAVFTCIIGAYHTLIK